MKNKSEFDKIKHIRYAFIFTILIILSFAVIGTIWVLIIPSGKFQSITAEIISLGIFYSLSFLAITKLEKKTKNINPDFLCWFIFIFYLVIRVVIQTIENLTSGVVWSAGLFSFWILPELFMPIIVPIVYDKWKIKKKK